MLKIIAAIIILGIMIATMGIGGFLGWFAFIVAINIIFKDE